MSFPVANLAQTILLVLAVILSAGGLCIAYGVFLERRWYRRVDYRLPILPATASAPLSILHLSDLHFVRRDEGKARFLRSLPAPDVAIVTGDLLAEPAGVETVVEALRPLRGRLASYFVLGSNDYFAPRPLNYALYFVKRRGRRKGRLGRAPDLIAQLEAEGWVHLRNARTSISADGTRMEVAGLDDPHIERHDLRVAPRKDRDAFGLAVVHSPDPAPELAALGYDLIVSGHTHGGQVRMPFVGALVSNCQIPNRLCMGLSKLGRTYLHISPGLGTSKFAPFRFLCRPEATFLQLVPAKEIGKGEVNGSQPAEAAFTARSNTRS